MIEDNANKQINLFRAQMAVSKVNFSEEIATFYPLTISQLETSADFDNPDLIAWLDLSGNGTGYHPFIRKNGVYIDVKELYDYIKLKEYEEAKESNEEVLE